MSPALGRKDRTSELGTSRRHDPCNCEEHLPLFLIGVPLLDMGKIVTDALCDKYLKRPDDVK